MGALLSVMRDALPATLATTPTRRRARVLRDCRTATTTALRFADHVEDRPAVTPADAPAERVRAEAELRTLARALRAEAERLAADLARDRRPRRRG